MKISQKHLAKRYSQGYYDEYDLDREERFKKRNKNLERQIKKHEKKEKFNMKSF